MIDLIWLYSSKILSMILGLVVMVFYYNYLGPENIGLLSYVYVLLFYFGLLANDLAIKNVVIRYESEAEAENKNGYFSASFIFKIIVSIASWFALIIYAMFLNTNERIITYILGASLLFAPLGVFNYFLEYEQKFRLIAQVDIVIMVLNSVSTLLFIYLKAGLIEFAVLQAFFLILRNLVLAAISFKNNFKFKTHHLYRDMRLLLRSYWPLSIGSIIILLYIRIDQIIIKHYKGLYYLGIYVLVVSLIEKVTFVPLILKSYLYPKFARLKAHKDFIQLTSKVANVTLPIMGISVLFCMLFARDIGGLFAKEYPLDIFVPTFIAFSFSFIGIFSAYMFNDIMILFDAQKKQTLMFAVMLVVNVILNLLLVPRYSIMGAAITSSVTQCLVTILPYFFVTKMRFLYKILLKKFIVFWGVMIIASILFFWIGYNCSLITRVGLVIPTFIVTIIMTQKTWFAFGFLRNDFKKYFNSLYTLFN